MSDNKQLQLGSLLETIGDKLKSERALGSHSDLSGLADLMEEANKLALELGVPCEYEDELIVKLRKMQERAGYYNRTGLDAPSLSQ